MSTVHVLGGDAPPAAVDRIGGKGAGLQTLLAAGMRVPEAFVLCTDAYIGALAADLRAEIERCIADLGPRPDSRLLDETAAHVRARVVDGTGDHPAEAELCAAYRALGERIGEAEPAVAVRSSSAAEDSADRSFAGEHDSYLWVRGPEQLSHAVRRCWASLFTARVIAYRAHAGTSTGEPDAMAVVVQRMVPARAAGVLMTLNPVTGDRSRVVVEAVWGLGEPLVSGSVTPDRFTLDKVTGDVVGREVVEKTAACVQDPAGHGITTAPVVPERRDEPCLSDAELAELLRVGRAVERHAGCPQDAEFAVAEPGGADAVYLVQVRPETVWAGRSRRLTTAGTPAGRSSATAAIAVRLSRPRPSPARTSNGEDPQ